MSLSTQLCLTPSSQPHVSINTYNQQKPLGVVEVDGLVITANRACDLGNLGKALLEAAERLAAAQVNEAHTWPLTVGAETPGAVSA